MRTFSGSNGHGGGVGALGHMHQLETSGGLAWRRLEEGRVRSLDSICACLVWSGGLDFNVFGCCRRATEHAHLALRSSAALCECLSQWSSQSTRHRQANTSDASSTSTRRASTMNLTRDWNTLAVFVASRISCLCVSPPSESRDPAGQIDLEKFKCLMVYEPAVHQVLARHSSLSCQLAHHQPSCFTFVYENTSTGPLSLVLCIIYICPFKLPLYVRA